MKTKYRLKTNLKSHLRVLIGFYRQDRCSFLHGASDLTITDHSCVEGNCQRGLRDSLADG